MVEPLQADEGDGEAGRLRAVGLFGGIGGFEVGFAQEGVAVTAFCERDEAAQAVLKARFPGVACFNDVTSMRELPECEILTAGFPCQDLSQAGPLAGIKGEKSGLVTHVFRLLRNANPFPDWVILENVPFMLSLGRGAGMAWLVDQLEGLGMRWAYRVVDSRAFGLAQRRRRLYIVASRSEDPRRVLFSDNAVPITTDFDGTQPCGFYWTEGNTGLGWAVDAVPPLKGSSGLGIICPPAVWVPSARTVVTPSIAAAEQLQGFPAEWTRPAEDTLRGERLRWKLVGNAVSPPVAAWLARSVQTPSGSAKAREAELTHVTRWPLAAWGRSGKKYSVDVSEWPVAIKGSGLAAVLGGRSLPLSARAAKGFYTRLSRSSLRVPDAFKRDLGEYVARSSEAPISEEPALRQHTRKR